MARNISIRTQMELVDILVVVIALTLSLRFGICVSDGLPGRHRAVVAEAVARAADLPPAGRRGAILFDVVPRAAEQEPAPLREASRFA